MSGPIVNATILIERGLKANLPSTGSPGQPFFCTDTGELFVWNGTAMIPIGTFGTYNPLTDTIDDGTFV